ncbi:MAG: hypothetical protein AAFX76_04960 [Planctomycetota bacterium]
MSRSMKSSSGPRYSSRQAAKIVHEIRLQHLDPAYQAADRRLRIFAAVGILIFLVGLIVGDRLGSMNVMGAAGGAGLGLFGWALWRASRNYKRDYHRFIARHQADDGTLLFCPECRYQLGDPDDAEVRSNPPRKCPECGGAPWRLEKPGVPAG